MKMDAGSERTGHRPQMGTEHLRQRCTAIDQSSFALSDIRKIYLKHHHSIKSTVRMQTEIQRVEACTQGQNLNQRGKVITEVTFIIILINTCIALGLENKYNILTKENETKERNNTEEKVQQKCTITVRILIFQTFGIFQRNCNLSFRSAC